MKIVIYKAMYVSVLIHDGWAGFNGKTKQRERERKKEREREGVISGEKEKDIQSSGN